MTEKNDGGPAFPLDRENALMPVTDMGGRDVSSGMSLRDYFAAHADIADYKIGSLERAAAFVGIEAPQADDVEALMYLGAALQAKLRYMFADAMLAARKQ